MATKRYKIPTCTKGEWGYTIFPDREPFREWVKSIFKEPGKYKFDDTSYLFNEQARIFEKKKLFCEAPEGSRDYQEYWDTEKEKCTKGCIFDNGKGGVWYLPRFYYHWINLVQIGGKESGTFQFPYVWDTQYHMALYKTLARLYDKDAVILKKRQIAASYLNTMEMYNQYLFDESYVGKMMASKKSYIDATNGSWKMFGEYHNFTNMHSAWACLNNPDKEFSWQQRTETKTSDGRKVNIGTQATLIGITLDKDPVAGVGGRTKDAYYEEGGVAPTADKTYIYMKPALKQGAVKTGMFTISGSVGELSQCEPLKKFIKNPDDHGFYAVTTDLIDANGTVGDAGLFIPEQWSYPPYIDEYGNSRVEEALVYLNELYEKERLTKSQEEYQTLVSQGPRNIEEAFAIRTISIFPSKHTVRQVKRIENNELFLKNVDLERTDTNEIKVKPAEREPNEYPIKKTAEDKRGCVVVHVHPGKEPKWGAFYASVDPVEVGKSDHSDSLASIYIYMNPIEVTKIDENGDSVTYIEGGKLAAEWTGRYDDPNETNEYISMLIEYYNAWAVVENNKTTFINHMILKKRAKYLAPASEMLFDKELEVKQNVYQKYGYTRTPALWKKMLEYGVNYLSEELGEESNEEGKITKVKYGVERIPFIWLLKEMQAYVNDPKKNFDRISAYCPLIAFAKIQHAAHGYTKKVERKEGTNKPKTHTFDRNTFLKSIGNRMTRGGSIFKSMR
jgi:hypothetical protein